MRLLNILVIAVLIMAASFVYKIKFDSTLQLERIAKLRGELRKERNMVANLRAEWARLEAPDRIKGLASRHLPHLRQAHPTQFDTFDRLPERPPVFVVPPGSDPIGAMIAMPDATGSIGRQKAPR